jgi:Arm DNA-binding domain/Phage integrase, N-terminal SAM-like domain
MPTKAPRVYADGRAGWYFKIRTGRDPITGAWQQVTKRGYRTAAEAGRARRELLGKVETGAVRPTPPKVTLNDLLDLYLDGLDADGRLSAKTRFDYQHYADDYVRPMLGGKKLHDLTPEAVLAWQRRMAKEGGTKAGKPLAPNTIRLARAPLSGALKLGVSLGLLGVNPAAAVPRPRASRSIPRHWTAGAGTRVPRPDGG